MPPTADELVEDWQQTWIMRVVKLVATLTIGWPLYLFFNVSGRKYERPAMHKIFESRVSLHSHWSQSRCIIGHPVLGTHGTSGLGFGTELPPPCPKRERKSQTLLGSLTKENRVFEGISVNGA